MFRAAFINEDRLLILRENETEAERVQFEVNVGSLGIYRGETGILLQDLRAEEGNFVPDETIPLVADVITRMKTW